MGVLRLLLALSVVFAHSTGLLGTTLFGGSTAVECFFVISGFYMAMVLERKYFALEKGVWRTFMRSRLARLYPVYFTVLLATTAVSVLSAWRGRESSIAHAFSALSIPGAVLAALSNVTMFGQDFLTFTTINAAGLPVVTDNPLASPSRGVELLLMPQAWSISLELLFYVCAPFVLRLSTKGLVIVAAASALLRLGLVLTGLDYDPWSYRFFPAEMLYFVAGALGFRTLSARASRQPRWLGPALLLGATVIAVFYRSLSWIPGVPFTTPLLLALAVPSIFEWTKRNSKDRWIGETSYPLYLVHMLVAKVINQLNIPLTGTTLGVASLIAAAALLLTIDMPFEKWRQARLARTLSSARSGSTSHSGEHQVTSMRPTSES